MKVLAPAKLNLFLHVVGRRADGFHELQTVFQFIDFGDDLEITVRGDGRIERLDTPGIPEETDLALRAAHALRAATGCREGCDIAIAKRIPIGGGLGGGSSDAAGVLMALNRLWQLNLTPGRLAEIGLQLGADVPVFVRGQAAWAEGIGEKLTPIDLPQPWYLVLAPPCAVSTAELFSDAALRRDTPRISIEDFLAGKGGNDFEPVVRRRHPEVAAALDWLRARAPARLSGTGASVFAAFESEGAAQALASSAPERCRAIVARGCNRSPCRVA